MIDAMHAESVDATHGGMKRPGRISVSANTMSVFGVPGIVTDRRDVDAGATVV